MGQIFISYSRADKDFVDRLARDVERDDELDVWTDREDISGGEDWYSAIGRAIRECAAFVLVLTPSSASSEKVAQELSLADKHHKRIIPLVCKRCEVPDELDLMLARRQWIDFTPDYDDGLRRLIGTLKQGQAPQPRPKPQPAREEQEEGAAASPERFGPAPPPPASPPQLMQVLPGAWNVTVTFPMTMPFTIGVEMWAGGAFRIRLPMSAAQGQWGIAMGNVIQLQGVESNGMMSMPYFSAIQVLEYDAQHISGVGNRGEQVFWQRIR